MKLKFTTKLILLGILILAVLFRFYNLNWDSGHYLHPDERAILMTITKLAYPHSLFDFFSPHSAWNTNFFAYGSFPFYLLKIVSDLISGTDPLLTQYPALIGRFISALADVGTILILLFLGRKLFSTFVGLTASFFYTISVLPIQLSHFFAVDTLLTFFILSVLYALVLFYEKPSAKKAAITGMLFGFALATKISALVLVVPIGAALMTDFLLIYLKNPHRPRIWIHHVPILIKHLVTYGIIIAGATVISYFILEPYAFIDFQDFWIQTQQQAAMTRDAFTFPYTLQYVGKIPYLYEAKNIFFFGMGPLLATLSFVGTVYFLIAAFKKEKTGRWAKEVIISVFFLCYFFIVGRFAVGWIRYMLPVYPLLALFAAFFVDKIFRNFQLSEKIKTIIILYGGVILLIWPLSFMHIYTRPNTRVEATTWILNNIQSGKILAQEHWDDPVPMSVGNKYRYVVLPLYDPDTPEKWQSINLTLSQTDYIIIASNRLYTPLQKLTNCQSLPPGKCYTRTAEYYRDLFSGALGFKKVAEFTNYPTVPIFNIPINDQWADESFTVLDHPKIMIFQRINP